MDEKHIQVLLQEMANIIGEKQGLEMKVSIKKVGDTNEI